VLLIGLASGRVKSVAGQVVTFDETVTVEDGKTYGMSFGWPRRPRRSFARGRCHRGRRLQLADAGRRSHRHRREPGCLFAFGETAQEYAVYRVQAIAHQKDLIATLTLVDDAPAISTADRARSRPIIRTSRSRPIRSRCRRAT
jgi:hypothetical protein